MEENFDLDQLRKAILQRDKWLEEDKWRDTWQLLSKPMNAITTATTALQPKSTKSTAKAEKIQINRVKGLSDEDLQLLATCSPHIVESLFRNRICVGFMADWPMDWLDQNCKGFYLSNNPDVNTIAFELEDDMLLFRMTFEGTIDKEI